jgi:hypothetical protein
VIVVDMTEAQAIKRGARTARIRRSLTPYRQLHQPIVVLREARPEDPAVEREQQLKTTEPVVREHIATITITDQTKVKLRDITADQAAAAGYPNLREFRRAFTPEGEHVMPNYSVLLMTFTLKRQEVAPLRLLGRDGQYTAATGLALNESGALAGEAVDEFTQARLSEEARTADELRHQRRREQYEQRTTEERLKLAKAEAVARGVDISHHERVILDRVDRIERQLGKDKAA